MADTTITITIPEAQFTTLQKAMSTQMIEGLSESDVTPDYVKNALTSYLKNIVVGYDKRANATVNYSSFSPS
jgi:hypothetical protein